MNVFIKSIEMNERKVKAGRKENEYFVEGCSKESCFKESCFKESCFKESCFKESCFKESRPNELFQGELLQRKPSQWSLLP